MATAFEEYGDIELIWSESGKGALARVQENRIDLVITDRELDDMTGLDFAGKLLKVNPMIHCAVVSDLLPEKFHEVSEGLGLVAQLPVRPGKKDSEDLLRKLKTIRGLLAGEGISVDA